MRNELGLKTISDSLVEELQEEKPHKKLIKSCHNYEIVSNPKYSAQFQYTSVDMRDTQEEKETSDMVVKMINLAFFQDSTSKDAA